MTKTKVCLLALAGLTALFLIWVRADWEMHKNTGAYRLGVSFTECERLLGRSVTSDQSSELCRQNSSTVNLPAEQYPECDIQVTSDVRDALKTYSNADLERQLCAIAAGSARAKQKLNVQAKSLCDERFKTLRTEYYLRTNGRIFDASKSCV